MPNQEELKKFLVTEKGFAEARVENGAAKIIKFLKQGTQSRLDSFFTGHKTISSMAKESPASSKGKPKASGKKPGRKPK